MITGTIKKQPVVKEVKENKEVKTIQEVREPKVYPKQFAMIKNTLGGLAVPIEPHDFSAPRRTISFKHDQEKNYLPTSWALGIFVTPQALRQMELGYFTFENLDILIEMAEEKGYYVPDSIREPKITIKEIANILRRGDEKELRNLTLNMSSKVRGDILTTARKMYSRLNVSTVRILEERLKVSLEPVNLND